MPTRKNGRVLFLGAAVLAAAVAVFLSLSELSRVLDVLRQANAVWLVLAVLPQAGTYYTDALTYTQAMGMLRIKAKLANAFSMALSMEFLNDITPSFGAASNIYLTAMLRDRGLNPGQAGLTLMVQSTTSFVAFSVALLAAAGYLLARGELNTATAIGATIFIGVGAVFWMLIALSLVSDKRLVRLTRISKSIGEKILRRPFSENSLERFIYDVRNGRKAMGQSRRYFLAIVVTKISRFFFEGLTIFVLFKAFGLNVSYEVALLGFLVAMLLSTFSFLPGGLGSFETLMVLTYKSHGVPLETAGVVTLAYRVITFWLPMPAGMLAFHRTMTRKVNAA